MAVLLGYTERLFGRGEERSMVRRQRQPLETATNRDRYGCTYRHSHTLTHTHTHTHTHTNRQKCRVQPLDVVVV